MDWKSFLSILKDSFSRIKDEYGILLLGVCAELLFIILFMFFSAFFSRGMLNNIAHIGDNLATGFNEGVLNVIVRGPNLKYLILLALAWSTVGYVLYCFFHGSIWKICMDFGKKTRYLPYIRKFFLINLIWYPIFLCIVVLNFFLSYMDAVGRILQPEIRLFSEGISYILLFILLYFVFISYVLIDKHSIKKSIGLSFSFGLRKSGWLIATFLVIVLGTALVNYTIIIGSTLGAIISENLSYAMTVILGAILVFPLLIWARIWLISMVKAL